MCECRDCDNFKAKRVDPKVGDRVSQFYEGLMRYGLVVEVNIRYSFVTGSRLSNPTCLVVWDNHDVKAALAEPQNLTVID